MSWARIDDGLHDHPKFVGLPLAAVGVWTLCLAYAGKRRSPSIPRELPRRFGASLAHIQALLNAGLWEEQDDAFVIHDWDEYAEKPSTERTRRYRERHGNGSRTKSSGSPVPEPVPVKSAKADSGVAVRVFDVWREVNGHPSARMTAARTKLIGARLREGYDEDVLTDAGRGVKLDPWPERALHDAFEIVFRDGAHVEKFCAFYRDGPPKQTTDNGRSPENPVDKRIREFGRNLEFTA